MAAIVRCWRSETPARFGPLDAQRFAETLARRLGLDPEYVNPAFEDPVYYLQRERQLPINVDPAGQSSGGPERARARAPRVRAWTRYPAGFVLPCSAAPVQNGPEWQTGLWMLRGAASVSGAGRFARWACACRCRACLGSRPGDAPQIVPVDPMVNRGPLPSPAGIRPTGRPGCNRARARNAIASPRWASPRRGSFARRCAWSLATDGCTFSCRPLTVAEDYRGSARRHRRHGRASENAGGDRRLHAALRFAHSARSKSLPTRA